MIEAYIRPTYQRLCVNNIAKYLSDKNVSPDILTIIGGIIGVLTGFTIGLQLPWIATLLILLSGYFDTLDGTVARIAQRTSAQGTVLDITTDRIVEFAIIYGLFTLDPLNRAQVSLWMCGAVLICVTTFLVVGVFANNETNKSFYYSPGIIERPEAFGFFILMILIPSWFHFFAWLFVALVLLTAIIRIREFYHYSAC